MKVKNCIEWLFWISLISFFMEVVGRSIDISDIKELAFSLPVGEVVSIWIWLNENVTLTVVPYNHRTPNDIHPYRIMSNLTREWLQIDFLSFVSESGTHNLKISVQGLKDWHPEHVIHAALDTVKLIKNGDFEISWQYPSDAGLTAAAILGWIFFALLFIFICLAVMILRNTRQGSRNIEGESDRYRRQGRFGRIYDEISKGLWRLIGSPTPAPPVTDTEREPNGVCHPLQGGPEV